MKLNITIGAKGFTNRSATLSGLTFSANNTYYSNISFSTTEGYIVGGVIWANGNLYKSNGQYLFYNSTEIYGGSGSCFICNSPEPYPTQTMPTSAWAAENDPCRKLTNAANKWRMPTLTEIQQLANSGFMTDVILNGVKGINSVECYFCPIAVIGRNLTSVMLRVESGDSFGLLRVQP